LQSTDLVLVLDSNNDSSLSCAVINSASEVSSWYNLISSYSLAHWLTQTTMLAI